MVRAMRAADDLFFDVISQIRMPAWSRGRVALVGDAAYAPSFLTGQAVPHHRRSAGPARCAAATGERHAAGGRTARALGAHPARVRRRGVTGPTLET